MKIYNTLTRQKEEFVPITPGEAKIYACGPTVYNYIHIGNARPICVFDVLRRYLEYRGMKVTFVQNFTDIDDKIIRKANEENSDYLTVSRRYIEEYKKDAEGLNVRPATIHPLATENIDEIISIISTLVEKGFAYRAENGDVYFRTLKFQEYGKLSHQPLDELMAGARISVDEVKEDPMDFAVWKAAKPGEPSWPSPWSDGRPGWHIECSAMARRYLGNTIDIHCGGQDLIFPHHENEIAQSECCNGVEFAHYWMHNGYINVDNRKMSKSLNNFFTVRDVAEKYGYEPIRYLMVASHYRSPINYSVDVIEQCRAALDRLYNCRDNLAFVMENAPSGEKDGEQEIRARMEQYRGKFVEAMEDDLNTADALSALFDLARDINTSLNAATAPSKELCTWAMDLFMELAGILGLLYKKKENSLDQEIEDLIARRTQARKEKDWATADKIRDELKARHVVLEDTPQGVKWHIEE
ncbi:MAG TPA: cysteine--tRNA ligase [Candidatus Gallacutalibacter pullicola]|uniref:Cysteine--tRNA ligase n=1 Tax=Candidatus Gallacutalibacter pullicola TaxID=2840830 RepID=A0A9D1J254_9FIRM|nr:cysteine--tRNA ligase [Candidatus Gallacutalibacter pullicola]